MKVSFDLLFTTQIIFCYDNAKRVIGPIIASLQYLRMYNMKHL